MSLFDDEFSSDVTSKELKPFHTIKKKDIKEKLEWLNSMINSLERQATSRNTTLRQNLESYRGISRKSTNRNISKSNQAFNQSSKFVVNHLHDMTETKVSQMCRMKPHVDVLPTNDEFEDKNAAKAVKLLINHLWYINDMDTVIQSMQRNARIFGESYLFIEWDKDMGDLHPMWVAARDGNIDLTQYDKNEQPVVDLTTGETKKIDIGEPIRTGDIKYTVEAPWRVFLQRKKSIKDVDFCFKSSVKATEDLKLDYPELKTKIKTSKKVKMFDSEDMIDKVLEEDTMIYEFFHKPTKYCPKGAYIKFTDDTVLEEQEYPYSHEELPFVRITDMDIPDILNGVSAYDMLRPLQNMHNNLSTLLAKNIYLTGHAKWVMPRGACKIESLGNDNTIVQYQGAVAPQMLQVRPNPPEAYNFRNMLVQEMGQVYGVQGVSRGAPPPGITAGVALQFLNEQEQERATSDVAKHNEMIQSIARKTISVAGDYYAPDDGRMLRIVGKDNQYSIRHFDSANLSKDYDVRVQVGSALPESKAGKIQRIIEIMQMKPDLLSNERWIDLLEFGNTEKMNTLLTAAVKAAESENEDILAGKSAGAPETWEDHIVHWRTHMMSLQSRSFKEETPEEIRLAMIEHISVTEFAMIEKAKTNPLFEAKLAELPLFPIASPDFTARSRQHMEKVVEGQVNRGVEVTATIPGTEKEEGITT